MKVCLTPVASPHRAAATDRYMIDQMEIPSILLMERAASALAREAAALCPNGGEILVICGKGNNGGDGLAAARILLTQGYSVYCGIADEPSTGDAQLNSRLLLKLQRLERLSKGTDIFIRHSSACVIIDALFGTGLKREPEGLYAELIDGMNAHSARVVAADIPSGVFGENGQAVRAVKADVTVTFQYPKPGHFIFPGRAFAGRLVLEKIGVDEGIAPFSIFHLQNCAMQPRPMDSNKGSYGKLNIIAGSKGMAGAAVLSARASVAAGSGLTRVGCCEYVGNILQVSVPEATVSILGGEAIAPEAAFDFAKEGALAIGPGLGGGREIGEILRLLLPADMKKVVDADALNAISRDKSLLVNVKNALFTPHPKEFSRLSGMDISDVLSDPVKAASEFALMNGITVLLKGATTVVSNGEKSVLVTAGSPSMAKGGSGDVLTGVAGSLLAQGLEPFEAAYAAAYFCGKAGERAAEIMGCCSPSPTDTIKYLKLDN